MDRLKFAERFSRNEILRKCREVPRGIKLTIIIFSFLLLLLLNNYKLPINRFLVDRVYRSTVIKNLRIIDVTDM